MASHKSNDFTISNDIHINLWHHYRYRGFPNLHNYLVNILPKRICPDANVSIYYIPEASVFRIRSISQQNGVGKCHLISLSLLRQYVELDMKVNGNQRVDDMCHITTEYLIGAMSL